MEINELYPIETASICRICKQGTSYRGAHRLCVVDGCKCVFGWRCIRASPKLLACPVCGQKKVFPAVRVVYTPAVLQNVNDKEASPLMRRVVTFVSELENIVYGIPDTPETMPKKREPYQPLVDLEEEVQTGLPEIDELVKRRNGALSFSASLLNQVMQDLHKVLEKLQTTESDLETAIAKLGDTEERVKADEVIVQNWIVNRKRLRDAFSMLGLGK